MADQQAGWYPDPSGNASRLRYWDGAKWTSDFTDVPSQSAFAQQTQAAQIPVQPMQTQAVISETPYHYPPQTQINQGYGQTPPSTTNGLAIAALICGIAGFCTAGVSSIAAIIMGIIARKNPVQKGLATAGLITGIISLALWVLYFIFAVILVAASLI